MSSLRSLIVLAATSVLVSCGGTKSETTSAPAGAPGAVTQTMTRSTTAPHFYIDQLGTASGPTTDKEIPVPSTGPLLAAGWAVDANSGLVSGVEIAIDQKPFPALYGVDRPDVAAGLKNPLYNKSGFLLNLPASQFSNGVHTITVRIIDKDRRGYFETPAYHVHIE
jgi:hypothetical protein